MNGNVIDGTEIEERVSSRAAAQPRSAESARGHAASAGKVAEPDEVVGRGDEEEVPLDAIAAAMPQLAQAADRLHPAEDLFDPFADALTHGVAGWRVVRRSIALWGFCATCGVIPSCRVVATQSYVSYNLSAPTVRVAGRQGREQARAPPRARRSRWRAARRRRRPGRAGCPSALRRDTRASLRSRASSSPDGCRGRSSTGGSRSSGARRGN